MSRLLFSLLIAIGLFGHHTIALAANFTINTATTASVTNVDADNIVQIDITNEDSEVEGPLKVDLELEDFHRQPDESIQVFFAQAGQSGPAASRNITVELNGNEPYSVRLDVSQVQFGAHYSGYLCISYQPLDVPHCEQIKLQRQEMAQEAVIVVGQPQPVETVCSLGRSTCKPEEVRLDIREKSGRWPIRGLSLASLTAGQGGASLNPMQDLDIQLMLPCGAAKECPTVGDLWHIDPNDEDNMAQRTIPRGGQAVLIIRFKKDHSPALYKPRFSVLALNSKNATGTEVALEIKIRHTGWVVFLILLFSVLGSYGLTKMLRTALQRTKLLKQINRMRQDEDLITPAQIVPEVRLRAVLARTLAALNAQGWWSRWFYFPRALEDAITRANLRLPYIKRVNRLYKFWKRKSSYDTMVQNRALKELRDIINKFSRTPLEDDVQPKLITQLDNLESWSTEENKLPEYFWLSLKSELEQIQARIDLTRFQAPDCREWERAISDVATNLASGKAVQDTAVSLGQFADSLNPSTEANIQSCLKDGAKALQQLQPAQLDAIAQAIGNIPSVLKGIDSTGPVPAFDAIAMARQTIKDSALTSGWDVVDQSSV